MTLRKTKAAKKPKPAKQARKPAKPAKKKSSKNRLRMVKETTFGTQPSKEGIKPMTENAPVTAPQISTVEQLLASIEAKLSELVAIETYLANKVASTPQPAPVADVVVHAPPSVAATPAPAQQPATPAQSSAPPSRPGAGTVGGMVWDFCDKLSTHLGKAPTKEELLAAIKQYSPTFNGQIVNESTAATQYSKWRSATGLPRLARGFGAHKPAAQAAAPASVPTPSAPTIGAPVPPSAPPAAVQFPNMPTSAPTQQPAPAATPAFVPPVAPPAQLPIPAASVPSVIAPTATPAPTLPPWLRG